MYVNMYIVTLLNSALLLPHIHIADESVFTRIRGHGPKALHLCYTL